MAREIKFRGKRIDNGEWVYGYIFIGNTSCWILHKKAPHADDRKGLTPFISIEVDPETVGQFIGERDKNGRDVYEGDIWKHNGYIYEICFCDGEFGAYKLGYYQQGGMLRYGEVIGNIHENKEILEAA